MYLSARLIERLHHMGLEGNVEEEGDTTIIYSRIDGNPDNYRKVTFDLTGAVIFDVTILSTHED